MSENKAIEVLKSGARDARLDIAVWERECVRHEANLAHAKAKLVEARQRTADLQDAIDRLSAA